MGGTHFLQTGYLLLNRNAPVLFCKFVRIAQPLVYDNSLATFPYVVNL